MAVERIGSKTDVVVKLILVFFISLLSFSIGTFVGKKFSDNQHKISKLEPGKNSEEHGATSMDEHTGEHGAATGDTHGSGKSEALTDEEVAKLAEEFVADEEKPSREVASEKAHGGGHQAATHEAAAKTQEEHGSPKKEPAKSEHGAAAEHVDKVAKKVAEGKPTSEPEKESKKAAAHSTALPQQVAAANASGKFTVQVAAYPKEEEAQGMASDLKAKGFSAFYVQANVKGQTWYRVSVGLFTTEKEAKAYKEDLLTRAKVSSAMVQKIQ